MRLKFDKLFCMVRGKWKVKVRGKGKVEVKVRGKCKR